MRVLHLVLLVALPALLFAALGYAQPLDPADAADAASTIPGPLPAPGTGTDKGLLLLIASAAGVLIRVVIIPLLKSPIGGSIFKKVPPFVQQLILVVLACIVAGIEKLVAGGTLLDSLLTALATYGTASALYGVTAPAIEHRKKASAA
jgi:hypothetical protein